MSKHTRTTSVIGLAAALVGAAPAIGAVHLMQIEQVIGGVNGDTTAQAIQLRMRSLGQSVTLGSQIRAWDAAGLNPILLVTAGANVPNSAAGAHILFCSAGFASNTTPGAVCNFTMTNLIPASYLAAGSLTFEAPGFGIIWRLSWGGASYTGTGAGTLNNDADGNFNPPFAGSLPSTSLQALSFTGNSGAASTNNAAQYAVTAGAAVFVNNAGTSYTVTGPPTPTGACCDDDTGVCMNGVTQAACEGGGDRYGGDGSTCATISPPCTGPTGACCDDDTGNCTEAQTQTACEGAGDRYGGNNSTCATINPACTPPSGACCDDLTGSCTEGVTDAACPDRWGGANSTCSTINPACVPPPPPPPIQIALELIVGGSQTAANPTLAAPLGITDAGDGTGRLFIQDQAGLIRVIDAGGNLLKEPMLDLTAPGVMPPLGIDFGGGFVFDERGLLGLAFHPDFENSASPGYGKFYVRYSKPRTSTGSEPCDLLLAATPPRCHEEVLAQYTMLGDPLTSNVADASSEVILFRWDKPQFNHNSGHIEFGPDGMLYISTGDGGGANDGLCDSPPSHGDPPADGPGGNGQNRESKLGKMIRIDVDGTDGPGGLYGIPGDNPFAGAPPGLDEIYAYGFRNPFRFSFDSGPGGDGSLYVADVGQDIYEEVDDVVLGGNYGWAIEEGAHCFVPPCPPVPPLPGCGGPGLIPPISEYTHGDGGLAIVGGYVYRGAAYPQLQGKYVYGDFSADFGPTGRLYYFDLTGPEAFVRKEFFLAPNGAPFGQFLKGFGRDADGEIYVAASDVLGPSGTTGVIYKVVPPPANDIVWGPATSGPTPCVGGGGGVWPNCNPEATTRSLRFTVTGPPGPSKPEAIKVTMIDLQHPIPANLLTNPPQNFSGYESATCAPFKCVGGARNGLTCIAVGDCPKACVGGTNAGTLCPNGNECTGAGASCPATTCVAAVESNGCARWVGKPGTFLEAQDSGAAAGTYRAARLQCTPFYWDWKPEGLIAVVGSEIAPSSEYSVQVYGASCTGVEGSCTNVSAPVTMYTRRAGDVGPNFNPPATTTQPDAVDVVVLVNKFKGLAGAPVKAIAQIQPNLTELNADLSALDITAAVDGVKGVAYSFSGPCACPSVVPCGITACANATVCINTYGVGSTCVKTCVGGTNAGDPCINTTDPHNHCPGGGVCGAGGATPGFCRDRCGRCTP